MNDDRFHPKTVKALNRIADALEKIKDRLSSIEKQAAGHQVLFETINDRLGVELATIHDSAGASRESFDK